MSSFGIWLAVTGTAIAAGVAVPYGILSGGAASLEIVLFWCIFGLAVIALVVIGVARWRA